MGFEKYIETIEPQVWPHGICKIVPPKGWWDAPDYEALIQASKKTDIPYPVRQCISGARGNYTLTLLERPAESLASFRIKANNAAAQKLPRDLLFVPPSSESDPGSAASSSVSTSSQKEATLGDATEKNYDNEDPDPLIEKRVRRFWKTLSSMMDPPMYGADAAGTLFAGASACGWNVDQLDTPLKRHSLPIQGVTSSMLYVGQWAAMFAWHVEDMNLYSINYIHTGAPKSWYSIWPQYAQRFENMAEAMQPEDARFCSEFLRHKRFLFSPAVLKEHGIDYDTVIHHAGEFVITFPLSYHAGFNHGFNIAESSNFATKEWAAGPGSAARVCECSPDSVCIDLVDFTARMNAGYVVGKDGGNVVFADGTTNDDDFLFLDYGTSSEGSGETGTRVCDADTNTTVKRKKKRTKKAPVLSPIFGEHLLNKTKKKRQRFQSSKREPWSVGQSVEVRWSDGTWYPGQILRVMKAEDGDACAAMSSASSRSPKKIPKTSIPKEVALSIMYDSGEVEVGIKCSLVRPAQKSLSTISWPPTSSSSLSSCLSSTLPRTPQGGKNINKLRRMTMKPCSLRPTFFYSGDAVQIRWIDGVWYPANVDAIANDGSASVTYATGQSEKGVRPELMRRALPESVTSNTDDTSLISGVEVMESTE